MLQNISYLTKSGSFGSKASSCKFTVNALATQYFSVPRVANNWNYIGSRQYHHFVPSKFNIPSDSWVHKAEKLPRQTFQSTNSHESYFKKLQRRNTRAISSSRIHFAKATAKHGSPSVLTTTQDEPVGTSLIPVVNQLQEICALVGEQFMDLPQLVVVGGQSSGKSSVLENLVGRDFLPRGTEIVTRRPLILQLIKKEDTTEEWGEFLHKPGKKFSFDDIKHEIEADTERVSGKNKGISPDPIVLKVYSPNVLPLTLVDTPGIARVPVGDQPADIENRIRNMVMNFISQPNAIILAVTPATQDLATSDALKLAREVDPTGERTIGVLTKVDLMDKGTNALDILLGRSFPLKLGFTGVINRSQQDINNKKPIRKMLEDEAAFFGNHPTYKAVAEKCGTNFLAKTCNRVLVSHIHKVLPELKAQVKKKIKEKKAELQAYGDPIPNDKASQGYLLLQLLNKFAENFRTAIEGVSTDITTSQLNAGARILYIFNEAFAKQMDKIDPLHGLTVHDIKTAIKNASGARAALFVPDKAFEYLLRKQLLLLKDPCSNCAEMVLDELLKIISQIEAVEMQRFLALRARVLDIAHNTLRKCLKPTNQMIENLLACELAYINTNHPDFIGGNLLSKATLEGEAVESLKADLKTTQRQPDIDDDDDHGSSGGFFSSIFGGSKKPEPKKKPEPTARPGDFKYSDTITERDKLQIQLIRRLIVSYFKITQKALQDHVTKVIMHFLVNNSKESLQNDLVQDLYKEDMFEILLHEDPSTALKRKVASDQLEALRKAKKVIQAAELRELAGLYTTY